MPLLFAARSSPLPCSPLPDFAFHCRPPLSTFAAVIVCCCYCCRPLLPLSLSAAVVLHRRHLPIVVCHLLSSFPLVVCRQILQTVVIHRCPRLLLLSSAVAFVVIRRCCCPPLPSSTSAAIIATLYPPSLTARSCPSPLQSTIQSRMSLSFATIVIHHRCPPLLPYFHSSPLQQDVDCCIVSCAGYHNRLFVMVLIYLRVDFWQRID